MQTPKLSPRRLLTAVAAFIFVMIGAGNAMAQTSRSVKGRIVDDKNEALPGAAVYVQGTTNGTITDIDGNFVINCEADATLAVPC